MAGVSGLNVILFLLSTVGVGISYYAYFVETAKEKDEKYQAYCDISEKMSCSKVFHSEYGKGFGVVGRYLGDKHILNQPNSIFGLIFYSILAALSVTSSGAFAKIHLLLAILSNILSVYLAYILYFVLHDLCVVCVATYFVNFFIMSVSFMKVGRTGKKVSKKVQKAEQNKKKKNAAKKSK